jgi:hypothetical protein
MKKIIIDNIEYVQKNSSTTDVRICILQRGWVMVGNYSREENICMLENAHIIRRWGTTNGLGELAENGVLEETILDKIYGTVEFDYLTLIATIKCNIEAWKNTCK